MQLYFDKETGLLVKKRNASAICADDLKMEVLYSDYKDVGGVKKRAMKTLINVNNKRYAETGSMEYTPREARTEAVGKP